MRSIAVIGGGIRLLVDWVNPCFPGVSTRQASGLRVGFWVFPNAGLLC
jgi:hypothetical protein